MTKIEIKEFENDNRWFYEERSHTFSGKVGDYKRQTVSFPVNETVLK